MADVNGTDHLVRHEKESKLKGYDNEGYHPQERTEEEDESTNDDDRIRIIVTENGHRPEDDSHLPNGYAREESNGHPTPAVNGTAVVVLEDEDNEENEESNMDDSEHQKKTDSVQKPLDTRLHHFVPVDDIDRKILNGSEGTHITIPEDAVISFTTGRVRVKKGASNSPQAATDRESIPLETMLPSYDTEGKVGLGEKAELEAELANHKNGLWSEGHYGAAEGPFSHSEKLNGTSKSSDEVNLPVNNHRKCLRGEKLYFTEDNRKLCPGWRRILVCGLILIIISVALLLGVLAATGILLAESENKNTRYESGQSLPSIDSISHAGHSFRPRPPPKVPQKYPPVTEEVQHTPNATPKAMDGAYDTVSLSPPTVSPKVPVLNDATHSQTIVPNALVGEFTIIDEDFTDDLKDNNSAGYISFVTHLETELHRIFRRNKNDVLKIISLRSGSIRVKFVIIWVSDHEVILADQAYEIMTSYLKRKHGLLLAYAVSSNSVHFIDAFDECRVQKGGCSFDCIWNYDTLTKTCICEDNMVLLPDGKSCAPRPITRTVEFTTVEPVHTISTPSAPTTTITQSSVPTSVTTISSSSTTITMKETITATSQRPTQDTGTPFPVLDISNDDQTTVSEILLHEFITTQSVPTTLKPIISVENTGHIDFTTTEIPTISSNVMKKETVHDELTTTTTSVPITSKNIKFVDDLDTSEITTQINEQFNTENMSIYDEHNIFISTNTSEEITTLAEIEETNYTPSTPLEITTSPQTTSELTTNFTETAPVIVEEIGTTSSKPMLAESDDLENKSETTTFGFHIPKQTTETYTLEPNTEYITEHPSGMEIFHNETVNDSETTATPQVQETTFPTTDKEAIKVENTTEFETTTTQVLEFTDTSSGNPVTTDILPEMNSTLQEQVTSAITVEEKIEYMTTYSTEEIEGKHFVTTTPAPIPIDMSELETVKENKSTTMMLPESSTTMSSIFALIPQSNRTPEVRSFDNFTYMDENSTIITDTEVVETELTLVESTTEMTSLSINPTALVTKETLTTSDIETPATTLSSPLETTVLETTPSEQPSLDLVPTTVSPVIIENENIFPELKPAENESSTEIIKSANAETTIPPFDFISANNITNILMNLTSAASEGTESTFEEANQTYFPSTLSEFAESVPSLTTQADFPLETTIEPESNYTSVAPAKPESNYTSVAPAKPESNYTSLAPANGEIGEISSEYTSMSTSLLINESTSTIIDLEALENISAIYENMTTQTSETTSSSLNTDTIAFTEIANTTESILPVELETTISPMREITSTSRTVEAAPTSAITVNNITSSLESTTTISTESLEMNETFIETVTPIIETLATTLEIVVEVTKDNTTSSNDTDSIILTTPMISEKETTEPISEAEVATTIPPELYFNESINSHNESEATSTEGITLTSLLNMSFINENNTNNSTEILQDDEYFTTVLYGNETTMMEDELGYDSNFTSFMNSSVDELDTLFPEELSLFDNNSTFSNFTSNFTTDGYGDMLNETFTNSTTGIECREDQFLCEPLNKCINNTFMCDGIEDCPSGIDEFECKDTCQSNFMCGNSSTCIMMEARCDGIWDCENGTDEENCTPTECAKHEVMCLDGSKCIKPGHICDWKYNCKDRSDEVGCVERTTCESGGRFFCNDGLCIPWSLKCDGEFDCKDKEDEGNCTCLSDEFQCNDGKCLKSSSRCDGHQDCHDADDEMGCVNVDSQHIVTTYEPYSGTWALLCAEDWNLDDGQYLCQELGFGHALSTEKIHVSFNGTWMAMRRENLTDTSLWTERVSFVESCTSSLAAAVECQKFACGEYSGLLHRRKREIPSYSSSYHRKRDVISSSSTNQWPFIGYASTFHSNKGCLAEILTPIWLITSAECLLSISREPHNGSDWYVRTNIGRDVETELAQNHEVLRIISHPHSSKFRSLTLRDYDVALIRLKHALVFVSDKIGAICPPDEQVPPGITCFSGVLGTEKPRAPPPQTLTINSLALQIMDKKNCNRIEHYNNEINHRMLCTQSSEGHTICDNDEGTPLMCLTGINKWFLAGMLTYQRFCDVYSKHPAVFSNLFAMRKFLDQVTGQKQYEVPYDSSVYVIIPPTTPSPTLPETTTAITTSLGTTEFSLFDATAFTTISYFDENITETVPGNLEDIITTTAFEELEREENYTTPSSEITTDYTMNITSLITQVGTSSVMRDNLTFDALNSSITTEKPDEELMGKGEYYLNKTHDFLVMSFPNETFADFETNITDIAISDNATDFNNTYDLETTYVPDTTTITFETPEIYSITNPTTEYAMINSSTSTNLTLSNLTLPLMHNSNDSTITSSEGTTATSTEGTVFSNNKGTELENTELENTEIELEITTSHYQAMPNITNNTDQAMSKVTTSHDQLSEEETTSQVQGMFETTSSQNQAIVETTTSLPQMVADVVTSHNKELIGTATRQNEETTTAIQYQVASETISQPPMITETTTVQYEIVSETTTNQLQGGNITTISDSGNMTTTLHSETGEKYSFEVEGEPSRDLAVDVFSDADGFKFESVGLAENAGIANTSKEHLSRSRNLEESPYINFTDISYQPAIETVPALTETTEEPITEYSGSATTLADFTFLSATETLPEFEASTTADKVDIDTTLRENKDTTLAEVTESKFIGDGTMIETMKSNASEVATVTENMNSKLSKDTAVTQSINSKLTEDDTFTKSMAFETVTTEAVTDKHALLINSEQTTTPNILPESVTFGESHSNISTANEYNIETTLLADITTVADTSLLHADVEDLQNANYTMSNDTMCGVWSHNTTEMNPHEENFFINWPALGFLQMVSEPKMCASSVVSSDFVITSLNCLSFRDNQLDPDKWAYVGGMYDTDSSLIGKQNHLVSKIIPYPSTNTPLLFHENNLALVKLKKEIKFDKYSKNVCLPKEDIQPGQECFTAGWSKSSSDDDHEKNFYSLPVTIISHEECNKTANYNGMLLDSLICTTHNAKNIQACQMDVGSPLFCIDENKHWELQGILNFPGPCDMAQPAVYNSIASVRNWILETLGNDKL